MKEEVFAMAVVNETSKHHGKSASRTLGQGVSGEGMGV
jgi:hypothetical protein